MTINLHTTAVSALGLATLGAHMASAFHPAAVLRAPTASITFVSNQRSCRSAAASALRTRMQSQENGPVQLIVDNTKTFMRPVTTSIDNNIVQPVAESIAAGANLIQPASESMAESIDSNIVQPMAESIDNIGEYTPDPSVRDSRLALLAVAALSGTGYGAVRMLGDSFDSSSILAIRFIIAAIVLMPWLVKCERKVLGVALESGCWLAGGYVAQAVCLQTASAGAAAFLASLTTVVCPVIERLTGKRLDKKAWTAMGLAVLGAFALECGGSEMPHANDLIGLLQPVLFGMYMFRTENALEKHPDQGIPITAVQTSICAATSIGWWGFWQQQGLMAPPADILAQATPTAMDAASQLMQIAQPAIDLLSPTQSPDEAEMILGAIKSAPSAMVVEHITAATPVPNDVMQVVDAMMQPVAQATNSIEANSGPVADGVLESKLVVPSGVSEALDQAKLWATGSKVLALAWLGILSSAVVLAVETVAVGKLSSSETAVVFSTEPLWAAAMGSLLLGEQVGANTFVGGALVLSACISRVFSPEELKNLLQAQVAQARRAL